MDEGPSDQDALSFALRQDFPRTFCEVFSLNSTEELESFAVLRMGRIAPQSELSIFASDHGVSGWFLWRHHSSGSGGNDAEMGA